MEQVEIVLKIRNENNFEVKTSLLNGLINFQNSDCGLPKNVFVDVEINKKNSELRTVKYRELIIYSLYEPMAVKIFNTTNNRQLSFYSFDIMNGKKPLTPQLSIDGKPRRANDHWDDKIYNISDTQEPFIVDGKEVIDILLLPNQIFYIRLWVMSKINRTLKNILL